jgi:hypothetical protein
MVANNNFDLENLFYEKSEPSRLLKLLAQFELYKKISDVKGDIYEFGVFKGTGVIKWATFRMTSSEKFKRKIFAFDTFGKFPKSSYPKDNTFLNEFINDAGINSYSLKKIKQIIKKKNFKNIEFIKEDINKTLIEFIKKNKRASVALLHIDVDIYEPTKCILENLFDKVSKNGIVIFDDYKKFPGETKAVDDFLKGRKYKINTISFMKGKPYYIIKK